MPAGLYFVSKYFSFTFANTSLRATLLYNGTTYSVASMML
jgi:hypothetical protein